MCRRPRASLEALESETNLLRHHAQGADQEFRAVRRVRWHGERDARARAPGCQPAGAGEHGSRHARGPSTGAPTASSSTSTAPPTACWWCATTPRPRWACSASSRTADLAEALPDVPTLAAVLDVCRGRLVNVEIKDRRPAGEPRRWSTCLASRSSRRTRRRAGVVVRPRHHRPGPRRSRPTLPTGFLSFGIDPHSALAIAVEHGHTAVHPDVWTLDQRRTCPPSWPVRTNGACRSTSGP